MARISVVYTIGYEGTEIDQFIQTLKAVGVEVLADVRAIALSRKKGFSKHSLRERLEAEGIKYLHYIEIGDPKEGREAARQGRLSDFEAIYRDHLSSEAAQDAMKSLLYVARNSVTCLMCFERDPRTCHRTIVAEHLRSYNLVPFDLFGDMSERYVRNRHLLPSSHSGQSAPAA